MPLGSGAIIRSREDFVPGQCIISFFYSTSSAPQTSRLQQAWDGKGKGLTNRNRVISAKQAGREEIWEGFLLLGFTSWGAVRMDNDWTASGLSTGDLFRCIWI